MKTKVASEKNVSKNMNTINNNNNENVEVVKMSTNDSAKNSSVKNLLTQIAEKAKEQTSIFFTMPNEPVNAVITGCGLRTQEFKQGPSTVVDLRLVLMDESIKITQIPIFSKMAFADITNLLANEDVNITEIAPVGTKANLKDYKWVATGNIPITIKPNPYNGKVWIGRIEKINLEE